jgi:hypothetical protein
VTGDQGIHILRRFVKNYHPPKLDSNNEGFSRILYLDPSPNPVCNSERIDEIFTLLENSPLLIEEQVSNYQPKRKITVGEDGWSTIPPK